MDIISIIGGVVLIPVVDYVTKNVSDSRIDYVVAFVSSLLVGVVAVLANGQFKAGDVSQLLQSFALSFATSQTIYHLYWENSLVREKFTQRISPQVSVDQPTIADPGVPVSVGTDQNAPVTPEV